MHLRLNIFILICGLVSVLGDVNPVLSKKGGIRTRVKALEQSVSELKQQMEVKLKEMENRIKTLEECDACAKIAELNKTLNDLDECVTGNHNCDVNAECKNTVGSYTCTCKAGFTGDGKTCQDIDECVSGVHACHKNASCTNTVGSYTCSCNPPYTGDGKTCTLPASECQNYQSLTSADRKITYRSSYDKCDSGLKGWFRFQGAAGNKMPSTSCIPSLRCRTTASGWINGVHPTVAEGKVTRQVCFSHPIGCCWQSTNIQVRNCGSFYVYYFNGTPGCDYRYCGTD